jgi:protoporphyrinogen/coproporphyrinogen III oxidase
MSENVVIVGGGLSGLAVAFRLRQLQPNLNLIVLESRERVGGNIGTSERDGYRLEHGPNGFLDSKPGMKQLAEDLGLGPELLAASEAARKYRYVYHDGRVQRLPASPWEMLTTPLLSPRGKMQLLAEPLRRRPGSLAGDESVAAFARRRFGAEAAAVFMDALVTGIHAGDPEQLSLRAAFPRLAEFERENGSVLRGFLAAAKARRQAARQRGDMPQPSRMWSFREGLQKLITALKDRLQASIHTGVAVKSIDRSDDNSWTVQGEGQERWQARAVVLCAPAFVQAELVADLDAPLAESLNNIRYNSVAVVALGYRQEDTQATPEGFGYLTAPRQGRDVLGVQWCSTIFPDRAPPGHVLWRVLCGGTLRPDVYERDDETLVRTCHTEMQHALGVKGSPTFVEVVRWPHAIPQYFLGHADRVAQIETSVRRHPGLFVTGNAFHGVAMNDVAEQAFKTANEVNTFLTHR